MSDDAHETYARPAWLIIAIAMGPAIGIGICRLAYALVLPDMRETLGWSWSMAGLMNTVNSIGYLIGALVAGRIIRRFGMLANLKYSTLVCIVTLVLPVFTDDVVAFGISRLISGVAGAFAMIARGALASHIAQAQPRQQVYYLGLFYIGPAIGILISGFVAPLTLEWFGAGSWPIVWAVLATISAAMALALRARLPEPAITAGVCECRDPNRTDHLLPDWLRVVWRRLHRLHDFYDRLCTQCRRRNNGAERLLDLHRYRGVCATMGLEWRDGQGSQRPSRGGAAGHYRDRCTDPPCRQHPVFVGDLRHHIRECVLCGDVIGDRFHPPQLSSQRLASFNRKDDPFLRPAMLVAGAIASMIHAVTTRDGAPRAQSLQRGAPDARDFL